MTEPEGTPQDAELDSESSTDEATADVNEEPNEEPWEEAAAADYQERLREFENVESTPVASPPGQASQLSESDLEVRPPGDQSG